MASISKGVTATVTVPLQPLQISAASSIATHIASRAINLPTESHLKFAREMSARVANSSPRANTSVSETHAAQPLGEPTQVPPRNTRIPPRAFNAATAVRYSRHTRHQASFLDFTPLAGGNVSRETSALPRRAREGGGRKIQDVGAGNRVGSHSRIFYLGRPICWAVRFHRHEKGFGDG